MSLSHFELSFQTLLLLYFFATSSQLEKPHFTFYSLMTFSKFSSEDICLSTIKAKLKIYMKIRIKKMLWNNRNQNSRIVFSLKLHIVFLRFFVFTLYFFYARLPKECSFCFALGILKSILFYAYLILRTCQKHSFCIASLWLSNQSKRTSIS